MATFITPLPDNPGLSDEDLWVTVESEKMSGASAPYTKDEPNLSAYLEIVSTPPGGPNEILIKLTAPYDVNDKRAVFNIGGLFNLGNYSPLESSMVYPIVLTSFTDGEIMAKYSLILADKYGVPAVPGATVTNPARYVIKGARSEDALSSFSPKTANGDILHSYLSRGGVTFLPQVSTAQPSWIYIYSGGAASVELQVKMYYTDGTDESFVSGPHTIAIDTIVAIPSGYGQLDLENVKTNGKTISKYEVVLTKPAAPFTMGVVTYVLVGGCEDHETFLLYSNGLGGCESVRMRGKRASGVKAEKEISNRMKYKDFTLKDGAMQTAHLKGHQIHTVNSGFYSEDYIFHLRQLIMSDCWIINTAQSRYEKIIVESTELIPFDDDDQIYALSIKYRTAWDDKNFNIYQSTV